jgi:soluble lytic murein transglycosylase-like protein
MLEKYKPVANLTTVQTNTAASTANIRQPKSSVRQPMPLRAPTAANLAAGGDSVFEAMMAVNQSQNKIFDQVLDGPVSQQTQRQLAQLKAQTMKNALADEIKDGQDKPPAQAQAITAAEDRARLQGQGKTKALSQTQGKTQTAQVVNTGRTIELSAGHTIISGIETGRIFSPSQLTAFRQRVGLGSQAATEKAAQSIVDGVKQPNGETATADELTKFIRAGREGQATSAATVSKSKIMNPGDGNVASDENAKLGKNGEQIDYDGKLDDIIKRVGEALNLDPHLIKAVIKTESNFNHKAVSSAGAKGLMQLMPGTAKEMGVKDPFNPLDNIWGGARYLKQMLDSYGGNLNKALAAYNWGPGNVNRHGAGSKNMPRETRRYIEVVNRNYKSFKRNNNTA